MTQEALLKRNIFLVYLLTSLSNAWFWIAIWVYFYLRFTDYAGIGLLETAMILTYFLGEIPTGAIADLLGKKKTMIVSYLIQAIGFGSMGFADSFGTLAVGVIIGSLGGVLASGTVDALLYDSLLSIKQESRFEKVLGNTSTIRMATLAAVSIVGGYMYSVFAGLPFILLALVLLIAAGISSFLVEPPIDTDKFSFTNYILQTKKGFHELIKTPSISKESIVIIVLSMITVINGHVLIDTQLYAQGWSAQALGYISTIMFLVSAVLSQLVPYFAKIFGRFRSVLISAALVSLSMIAPQFLGVYIATVVILMRDGILQIFSNNANAAIHANTDSKYRATTISTYNMLSSIPYIFLAYFLGSFMDRWGVDQVAFVLGVMLLAMIALSSLVTRKDSFT